MPFIEQWRRDIIDGGELPLNATPGVQPGDLCYKYYAAMLRKWRLNARWTTAHEIFKELTQEETPQGEDEAVAQALAWQVFFQLHVMPYELKKREQNGDI